MRILLIEDDVDISGLVASAMGQAGFTVDRVKNCSEAEAALRIGRYALIILDRRLPDGDGLTLLTDTRAHQPTSPVIILTALDRSMEVVRGLDAGADDYLTKPFSLAELLARARAALRKAGASHQPPFTCGRLAFNADSREVLVSERTLIVTRRELSVLESLVRRAGRVVLRDILIEEVYGFDDDIQSNTLEAHVSRLRARLTEAKAGVVIHPVRGVGYMMDSE